MAIVDTRELTVATQALVACGWREAERWQWLPLADVAGTPVEALLARSVPLASSGRRETRSLPGAQVCTVGVGRSRSVTLVFGRRGYLPPMMQRMALAALCQGRLRFRTASRRPAPPGKDTPLLEATIRDAASVGAARRRLQAILSRRRLALGQGLGPLIAVTEAMINAVRHGGGGTLAVTAAGRDLRVRVEDGGRGIGFGEVVAALAGSRDGSAETGGRGFWLMLAHADRCDVLSTSHGTTVELRFAIRAPQRRFDDEIRS